MLYTVPHYYKKFHCIAAECPATCCAGWQIVIDRNSQKKYKAYRGPFGNRLKNSIDWKEGVFEQYAGRCAFLNEKNLCDIYTEAGKEMLCATCRKYPRHMEEFENEREISLSMSCPEAARLILGEKGRVRFLTAGDDKTEEMDDFDSLLYGVLQDTRTVLLGMMQNREEDVFLRMARVLALTHDVQSRIDAGRLFEVENLLLRAETPGALEKCRQKIFRHKKQAVLSEMEICRAQMELPGEWEVLDGQWYSDRVKWKSTLYQSCQETYHIWKKAFRQQKVIAPEEYEQMMVYFLFTYFCGAVYDGDAMAKAKMSVVSTLIWEEIVFALWIEQCFHVSSEDKICTAWRYCRELEHSDPNLIQMENLMDFRLEAECGILMGQLSAASEQMGEPY